MATSEIVSIQIRALVIDLSDDMSTCAICPLPKLHLELSTTADTNAIGLPIQ